MDETSHLCRNRRIFPVVKKRSRALRMNQTAAEKLLWEHLRGGRLGYKFRRQHSIGHLILDFYCPELHLGIELDGDIHRQREVRERDEYKQEYITGHGITLLRFQNDALSEDITKVIERIQRTAEFLSQQR